jgi:hypothetical protein
VAGRQLGDGVLCQSSHVMLHGEFLQMLFKQLPWVDHQRGSGALPRNSTITPAMKKPSRSYFIRYTEATLKNGKATDLAESRKRRSSSTVVSLFDLFYLQLTDSPCLKVVLELSDKEEPM